MALHLKRLGEHPVLVKGGIEIPKTKIHKGRGRQPFIQAKF
jgi:hypothetical protein